MIDFFYSGGLMMWVLLIIAIVIIIISIKKVNQLFIKKEIVDKHIENGIHSILFWGGMSALLGIFWQIEGIYLALSDIIRASDISMAIVFRGLQLSFNPTLTGLFILIISALVWFVLRWRYQKLILAQ